VLTNLKTSSKKYGWVGYAGVSEIIFGDNYGFLTSSIPGKAGVQATRGTSLGNKLQNLKKK
jgi:hypothetical protein